MATAGTLASLPTQGSWDSQDIRGLAAPALAGSLAFPVPGHQALVVSVVREYQAFQDSQVSLVTPGSRERAATLDLAVLEPVGFQASLEQSVQVQVVSPDSRVSRVIQVSPVFRATPASLLSLVSLVSAVLIHSP